MDRADSGAGFVAYAPVRHHEFLFVRDRQTAVRGSRLFFSAIAILVFIPITFHHWGLLGAVWTVALSDVPMYFVILYGLGREGMYPIMQDLKMTLVFLVALGTLVVLRLAVGIPFPHVVPLH